MKLNQLIEQLQEHARQFPESASAEVEIIIPEFADPRRWRDAMGAADAARRHRHRVTPNEA